MAGTDCANGLELRGEQAAVSATQCHGRRLIKANKPLADAHVRCATPSARSTLPSVMRLASRMLATQRTLGYRSQSMWSCAGAGESRPFMALTWTSRTIKRVCRSAETLGLVEGCEDAEQARQILHGLCRATEQNLGVWRLWARSASSGSWTATLC